mmetsp:Transcript_22838/g.17287  ORF Transcript_22838/g.17287 Transcript_22838/m.17287 type:complete len:121 (+) Transcript_22838:600-962(+)
MLKPPGHICLKQPTSSTKPARQEHACHAPPLCEACTIRASQDDQRTRPQLTEAAMVSMTAQLNNIMSGLNATKAMITPEARALQSQRDAHTRPRPDRDRCPPHEPPPWTRPRGSSSHPEL